MVFTAAVGASTGTGAGGGVGAGAQQEQHEVSVGPPALTPARVVRARPLCPGSAVRMNQRLRSGRVWCVWRAQKWMQTPRGGTSREE